MANIAYKKLLFLTKLIGRCTFAISEIPLEIPRKQTGKFPNTITLANIPHITKKKTRIPTNHIPKWI